jgi:streptogramin lyase
LFLGKLALAPDGSTWYLASHHLGHLAKDGKFLGEFDAKIAGTDLTWGPDGNVWFSAEWTAGLGRLSPSGTITMFPAPIDPGDYGSGFGSSVTSGPGGNLYYLDVRSDTLHRMTPSGADSVLASGLGGIGLAMGADGNLWVAAGNRLAKVTSTGVVSGYSLGSTGDARAIAPGPDGNVWFVETSANAIGRITPSGVLSVFPLPNPSADPTYRSGVNSLVAGPDGNVWFTELETNRIGRITPSGVITEYPLPKAIAGVGWIAPGPDGTLQFDELHEVRIVRFHP